jgi:predicted dehydrogenase
MNVKRTRPPLSVAIIGIGHRGYNTHFLSIFENPRAWDVVAICDVDEKARARFAAKHPTIPVHATLSDLLRACNNSLDFAIVCVPHQYHLESCQTLAGVGVPILKEKPVAESPEDYEKLLSLPTKIGITFQKRFEPRYLAVRDLLPHVGQVASFRATLTATIAELDATWRAKSEVGVTVSFEKLSTIYSQ